MPQESPESLVEAFLQEAPTAGGALKRERCGTCKLHNAEAINAAIRHFAHLRETGQTTQHWKDFHRYCLVPSFNYPLSVHAMRDHTRGCLELQ